MMHLNCTDEPQLCPTCGAEIPANDDHECAITPEDLREQRDLLLELLLDGATFKLHYPRRGLYRWSVTMLMGYERYATADSPLKAALKLSRRLHR